MPDSDLSKILSALRPPVASEAARERALHRSTLALDAARATPPAPENTPERGRRRGLAFAQFATVAAAVTLLGIGLWLSPPRASAPDVAEENPRRLLAELNRLFPGLLNAVIEQDGALRLDLAPTASPTATEDQAVVVDLRRAGRHLRILAYSGRATRVEIDGKLLSLEPLITSAGEVLVAGDDFVWSSASPSTGAVAGWQIVARPLALPL